MLEGQALEETTSLKYIYAVGSGATAAVGSTSVFAKLHNDSMAQIQSLVPRLEACLATPRAELIDVN